MKPARDRKAGSLRGVVLGLPLMVGGAFLLYRKLRQETPPAPAWDRELQTPPLDPGLDRLENPQRDAPPASSKTDEPRDRVEYTNEFGEKAAGIAGGGLDAVPVTPVDATEAGLRFGQLIGRSMKDLLDGPAGSIEAVYYRRLRGEPEWAATTVGLLDKRRVLAPLDGVSLTEDEIKLAVPNSMIEEAPTIEATSAVLDDEQEMQLYAHYQVRRMLPGLEGERDEDGLRLRMWAPVATEMSEPSQDAQS